MKKDLQEIHVKLISSISQLGPYYESEDEKEKEIALKLRNHLAQLAKAVNKVKGEI